IPQLLADERRVKEILLNLLSNAAKFSPPDAEVSVRVFVDKAGEMNFVISDNGIGMDEQELAIAMERFGRAEGAKHGKYDGTGLGLPLTKALIELHGGTLSIESSKGQGTKACVKFPKERVV
ncbi:MAG: ATP-binding protein, partial [Rhodospirillaceae bacterium]|nr:ATP-binding protein [Rhodospirillaceae bacterium]